jgi:two-component system response regulator HydG
MDSSKLAHPDFYQLDVLSEENPILYLEKLNELKHRYPSARSIAHLVYFQAKALVCMRQYEEAMQLASELLGKAVIQIDYYILVKCNILLSKCYYYSEDKYRTKPCLELAEEYAKESQDVELMATTLSVYGSFLLENKDDKSAQEHLLKAVALIKKMPSNLTTVSVMTRAAALYHARQDYDKVVIYLSSALLMCQEAELVVTQLSIIGNLVTAYIQIGNFSLAEELVVKGIQICNEHNHPEELLHLSVILANLKTNQNKDDEAIEMYDQCLALAESIHNRNPIFLIDIYHNYAICYGKKQDIGKALEYLDKSLEIARSVNNPDHVMQINLNKAYALISIGQFEEAKTILQEIIRFYRKHKNYDVLLSAQRNLALLYEKQHDYKSCISALQDIDRTNIEYILKIMNDNTKEVQKQVRDLYPVNAPTKQNSHYFPRTLPQRDSKEFIGSSDASKKVLNSALLAAQHLNTNVFIMGESGTGKEIIAHIIHYNSLRRDFPFVPVNTAAINASLVESELFGHTKGAFTGAMHETKGFFVQANKGTLFLDEITEMPIEFQAKLLRALESKKVTPVGSSKEIAFDSRIVSSSNRNIYELMQRNEFRLDLFHRINPIEIYIPPLRNRTEDIEVLVYHFIDIFTFETKKPKPRITKSFIDTLRLYSFPGNIRELKNIIERLFILSNTLQWDADVLSVINLSQNQYGLPFAQTIGKNSHEDEMITKALIQAGGKQKDAAKLLNMSESTLTRRIVKYNLENFTRKGK